MISRFSSELWRYAIALAADQHVRVVDVELSVVRLQSYLQLFLEMKLVKEERDLPL